MARDNPVTTDPRTAESLIADLKRLAGVACTDCRAPLCHHQMLMSIAIGFKDAPRCLRCLGVELDREPVQFRDFLYGYIKRRECFAKAWNWANRAAGLPDDTMPPALQSLAHPERVVSPVPSGGGRIPRKDSHLHPPRAAGALSPSGGSVLSGRTALPLPVRHDRGEGHPNADTPAHLQAGRLSAPQPSPPAAGGEGDETGGHTSSGREGRSEGVRFVEKAEVSGTVPADAEWDAGDMGCGELVLELRLRLEAMLPGQMFKLCARDPGAPEDLPAWCRLTGHRLRRAEPPNYWIERKEKS